MWLGSSVILLVFEIALLVGFAMGRIKKKKLNETFIFAGLVFLINYALHLVPFLYQATVMNVTDNLILGAIECIGYAIKLFVGEANTADAVVLAKEVPLFSYVYLLGIGLAMLATISTTVELFSNTLRNRLRLARAMNRSDCDIVVGDSDKALQYAKSEAAVLLLDDRISRERAVELMEDGYIVLRRNFSQGLFKGRQIKADKRYNIICPDQPEDCLKYIDTFIAYKQEDTSKTNIYLYVEIEEEKVETIRREIIENSGAEAYITTFCSNELLARTFIEANPVAKYLPSEFIESDTSVAPGVTVNMFFLGFGKLNREFYRQSVLNNQLVTFQDGEYRTLPLHCYIFDGGASGEDWIIGGLPKAMGEMKGEEQRYFPLPPLPCYTETVAKNPCLRDTLFDIKRIASLPNSYNYIVVDTDDDYCNIEIAAKLRVLLNRRSNFHVFVRTEANYVKDDHQITYFGKVESVFSHDVIVNDKLSVMAKKLNEVYTAYYMSSEKEDPDFVKRVKAKADADWKGFDYFTRYSNIFLAMNLRAKLNLLGLDYVADGKGENVSAISQRYYEETTDYSYAGYFGRSIRNALLAQEHARWNAYHLMNEYLPMAKDRITVKSKEGEKVRFLVKDVLSRKHACLTTFKGLDALSTHLAHTAGGSHTPGEYDYYIYDEMIITSADELLAELGCSVIARRACGAEETVQK